MAIKNKSEYLLIAKVKYSLILGMPENIRTGDFFAISLRCAFFADFARNSSRKERKDFREGRKVSISHVR
jgi:hypothetical protein